MENIAETLQRISRRKKNETGLIEAKNGRRVSFGQLNVLSDRFAVYLKEKGVEPGERVMLMVKPSAEFICLTFALFKIGAPVVLIDPGMGYKNLLGCIERVRPDVLIGIPRAVLFSRIFRKQFKSVTKTFCCGPSPFNLLGRDIRKAGKEGTASLSEIFKPSGDDLAAIIFTTGSTGPPKGVRYEHSIFAAQLRLIRDYYQIGDGDIDLPAFPLFALFTTALGGCAVIPDMDPTRPARVDPRKFVDAINRYNVTYSFGSPAIWNVVGRYCAERGIVLKSVRKILMAGAPVPWDLLQKVTKILPENSEIFTPYGATESLPIASIRGREILADTWEKSRTGKGTCVGFPLPGINIKIIAMVEGPIPHFSEVRELPPHHIGEIIVQGDVVTKAYENNDQETNLAKIADEKGLWHRMGDMGYFDGRGRLWFCGRKAHRVELADRTLYSVPCEAIINEHPDVYRSALVGIGRDRQGKCADAVIIVEPSDIKNTDPEKLLGEIETLASENTLTEAVRYFLVHESFPVDIRHNAKIFREKLALWAEEKLS
ncbi:fatty acid CoA ligase family protein [Desulfomarina sp.]